MYFISELLEEINGLSRRMRIVNTTREKLLLQEKINIKYELFLIMVNKKI